MQTDFRFTDFERVGVSWLANAEISLSGKLFLANDANETGKVQVRLGIDWGNWKTSGAELSLEVLDDDFNIIAASKKCMPLPDSLPVSLQGKDLRELDEDDTFDYLENVVGDFYINVMKEMLGKALCTIIVDEVSTRVCVTVTVDGSSAMTAGKM